MPIRVKGGQGLLGERKKGIKGSWDCRTLSPQAGPLTHIDDDNSHRNFSYFDIYTTNNFDDDTMKFLTLAGFFLLLVAGTMTAVDAATEAEQACGFARKIGSPCTIKLDGQHSIPGSQSFCFVFLRRRCPRILIYGILLPLFIIILRYAW